MVSAVVAVFIVYVRIVGRFISRIVLLTQRKTSVFGMF